jgi:DNA helicase II / ATP-dependent DNA helicase PcrA
MNKFGTLNPQQHEAVTSETKQILVLAGPGSGKTRVLTQRIAFLVYEKQVSPGAILAVTFTNKAAREMRIRLERMLGRGVAALWLGTFHSICAKVLRQEAEVLPFDKNFVIMDADDQRSIVKRILKDLNLDDKLYPPNTMHAIISNAKNQLTSVQDFTPGNYREEVARRIYERYDATLRNSNAVDFDDLLLWTVRLFNEHPNIRDRYSKRFEYVLIDEFQDTNQAQYDLVKHFASYHQNLFAVGDEDQSIYRWRGADYRNVQRFESEFPQSCKLLLEQNYRSTQNILDAAKAVINENKSRTPKNLFSKRGAGTLITTYDAVDDHAEASFVVEDIIDRIAAGNGDEIAIMYRTNAQSRLLEESFLRAGLPYRLVGAQRFYGRREVKDMIAFLRMVQNPYDMISFNRTINLPPRGIGDKTIETLMQAARTASCYPADVLISLGTDQQNSPFHTSFSARAASVLASFGVLLHKWRSISQTQSLPDLFDQIIADIDYRSYIDDGTDVGEGRWENVMELRQLAFEFENSDLTAFLERVALVSDQDTVPDELNAPTLLTLHAAKGLEFSTVYIVGLDDGILPHNRSFDDPEEMAEERRLFYVGITRAKNELVLVRASQRNNFGRYEYTVPSRFLDDLPQELIHQKGIRLGVRRINPLSQPRWSPATTSLEQKKTKPAVEQQYKAGMRVVHPVFGDGMVIETRILGNDEIISVMFETTGLKRLAASVAKLDVVA